jgi:hypothetical protein
MYYKRGAGKHRAKRAQKGYSRTKSINLGQKSPDKVALAGRQDSSESLISGFEMGIWDSYNPQHVSLFSL